VSPGRHFTDARYEDFLASAAAIGEPLAGAATRPLGATVRLAIDATARWTSSNTNLGIVLLLAPLARAALRSTDLRSGLREVLETTTVGDARDVYAAIRRAGPGGLGTVESQDVASEPDVTLIDAMRLAAGRDGIAHEYTTAFEVTFGTGAPSLEQARGDGLSWDDAVVETFLTLLAAGPDTTSRGGTARQPPPRCRGAHAPRSLPAVAIAVGSARSTN
jgi:triphosphoribosyl-dephospho-CoA synthase